MSDSVFLDTNGWITLLNSAERHHAEAQRTWFELAKLGSHFVVTDWVIAETGNGLARTKHTSFRQA
jgi:predicted nucleic acid-binding protein